jgi:AAA-like domain/Sigma-70, region 4
VNRQKLIIKFNELPPRRRMVLEKFLQGYSKAQIACELETTDDNLNQHLRQLYRDFGITNEIGERKLHHLLTLIKNNVPDISEFIGRGTPVAANGCNGTSELTFPEHISKSLYVERPPIEQYCYDLIKQPGSFIRIKAPSKMGKTWLMQGILQKAEKYNYQQVRLNLWLADEEIFSSLDKFLQWFCNNVALQLQLPTQIDYEWDEKLGSNLNCTNYFEKCLLAQIDHSSALVLGLDHVDHVFPYSTIASSFFCLLRYWYEMARTDKIWSKLRLIINYSIDIDIPLGIYECPFNFGRKFELRPFGHTEVIELVKQHEIALSKTDIMALINLVDGHPWLLNEALLKLKNSPETNLEELLEQAYMFSGIYSNHLLNLLEKLKQHPDLATAMKKVVDAATDSVSVQLEPKYVYQLKCMGLVRVEGNNVKPFCELYRLYFLEHL